VAMLRGRGDGAASYF